jgi:thioredoxin-like negative regulator of GroEL
MFQINAEKSPFLTERLKVWMLPTLALIRSGKTVDYVVGFQDLGGVDDFPTSVLEARLLVRDYNPLSRSSGVTAMGMCPALKCRWS